MIEIRPLTNIPLSTLYHAFSEAFKDYEMQLGQAELAKMLQRRGYDPALSFGAFDRHKLVAFTFNGIGSYQGIQTAYDTGTGTIEEYRGQGLARQIFTHSLPYLKNTGIKRYLLEVLQHNTNAVNLYLKLGFEIIREFYYYVHKIDDLRFDLTPLNTVYHMQPVDMALLSKVDYSDFAASWQNCQQSILRASTALKAVAIYLRGEIIAYCVYEPGTGDITSLAVVQAHRRSGLGSQLLKYSLQNMESEQVKVINIPLEDEGTVAFLSSHHMTPSGKQFEMVKEL